jgi:hypothetical protein
VTKPDKAMANSEPFMGDKDLFQGVMTDVSSRPNAPSQAANGPSKSGGGAAAIPSPFGSFNSMLGGSIIGAAPVGPSGRNRPRHQLRVGTYGADRSWV